MFSLSIFWNKHSDYSCQQLQITSLHQPHTPFLSKQQIQVGLLPSPRTDHFKRPTLGPVYAHCKNEKKWGKWRREHQMRTSPLTQNCSKLGENVVPEYRTFSQVNFQPSEKSKRPWLLGKRRHIRERTCSRKRFSDGQKRNSELPMSGKESGHNNETP